MIQHSINNESSGGFSPLLILETKDVESYPLRDLSICLKYSDRLSGILYSWASAGIWHTRWNVPPWANPSIVVYAVLLLQLAENKRIVSNESMTAPDDICIFVFIVPVIYAFRVILVARF